MAVAATAGSGLLESLASATPAAAETGPLGRGERRAAAYTERNAAALAEHQHPFALQIDNGDEARYVNHIGSYSKALPHDHFGQVDLAAYGTLLKALGSGTREDLESIALGGPTKLTNPQCGLAFDLEGADAQQYSVPPAPALSSAQAAGEGVELYWMALLRDVPFTDFATSTDAAAACADLNRMSDFRGPRQNGQVTTAMLFRDPLPGTSVGPYISQFMWLPTPFGAEFVDRHMRTYLPSTDQLTDYEEWLAVQNGALPTGGEQFDPTRRYVRCGRDLAAWVHRDVLFQAYFNACLILITATNAQDAESGGIGCPLNPGNPYLDSRTQVGFGTFGAPAIKGLMCEVAARGLKTTWHKKWFVHRRLRPEEWGGLVHNQMTHNLYPGVIHGDQLNSAALGRVSSRFGSFLLPEAFPEGCPTHPSYTAGHATVAGACVTILKAVFDETFVIPNPVVPSADGLTLVPYTGPDLTVGGELNKLASNIGTGRNIAGVHWRSDALESFKLGEAMAISILDDQKNTFQETRNGSFHGYTFTRFDGTTMTI